MKQILIASAISVSLVASQANSGGLAEPMMEPEVIVEEASASSGGFVLPLLLLALVALAVASNDDSSSSGGSSGGSVGNASDLRIKSDIIRIGETSTGLPLYQFRYLDTDPVFEGVMAQDVLAKFPEAVVTLPGGYMAVDYDMLGLEMKRVR